MKCSNCGGTMRFDVESQGLKCEYCGTVRKLPKPEEEAVIEDTDLSAAEEGAGKDWGVNRRTVTCKECGSVMFTSPEQISNICPFCGSNIILSEEDTDFGIAPSAIIPFSITKEEVAKKYYYWNRFALWAPESFRTGKVLGNMVGVYVPYWTFDADTVTSFSGKFGYTTDTRDGQTTQMRERNGVVEKFIDDVCICGSKRFFNDKLLNSVISFKPEDLIPYTPDALAGFAAEKYTIGVDEAWNNAKQGAVRKRILHAACDHVGADSYDKKVQLSTEYSNVKFKYILVPVWLTACRYKGQVYNVVASGHNGKGNCRRPISTAKIILLILLLMGVFFIPIISMIIMSIVRVAMAG